MHAIAFLPVLGIALYLLLRWLFRDKGAKANVSDAMDELVRLCYGDENRARRLLEMECRSEPGISRAEAARRAVDSILHDRK
ncbi:MAG: hypothetical protein ACOY82_10850 [Pseudomonadota bacterium]